VIDPRAALPASIEELSQKIASGGLWPVLVRVVGTWIAGSEVLVRRVLPEELFAWNVHGGGDAAGRRKVLEPVGAPGFPDALGDAVPQVVLAEFGHQP
jgi:hypothetical protein